MAKRVSTISKTYSTSTSWQEGLEAFLFWKQAQGLSKTTIGDYKRHVNYYFKRFPESWGSTSLKKCIIEYMADDLKPASFNLRLIYLKAFFNYCIKEGYVEENPLQDFKKRKAQGRIVDVPEDTLQKLISLPNHSTYTGLRDYAMILFTLDTGIRPKEALNLTIDDFDLKHNLATIPADKAKTRTARSLPLLLPTTEAINRLIKVRYEGWDADLPVFCSCEGTTLNTQTWGDRMEFYSKQIGTKIRPYDLRHAFALLYLRNGGHAFGLQKTLGHAHISMTRRYVNLSGDDLADSRRTAS